MLLYCCWMDWWWIIVHDEVWFFCVNIVDIFLHWWTFEGFGMNKILGEMGVLMYENWWNHTLWIFYDMYVVLWIDFGCWKWVNGSSNMNSMDESVFYLSRLRSIQNVTLNAGRRARRGSCCFFIDALSQAHFRI